MLKKLSVTIMITFIMLVCVGCMGPDGIWAEHKMQYVRCPICGNKTGVQIRDDTELKNFPLFCPKCRYITIINVKKFKASMVKESRAG